MQTRLDALPSDSPRRPFLSTYLRTTRAVGNAVDTGRFLDPDWVEWWDVAFAELYLRAHDAFIAGEMSDVPRPWRLAFTAPDDLPDDTSPAAQKSVDSLDEVERLLRKLSGKDREVVRLFYLEGQSYEEISTELDVPVNTIGAMLSRARKKLREMGSPATSTMEVRSLKSMVEAEAREQARRRRKPARE